MHAPVGWGGVYRRFSSAVPWLASEGALYLDAVAPSTWSLPSHGSLFTGWFPSAHKVHGEHRMLGPHPPTLGDVLYRNGFDTLSFTANPHISDSFGLSRGFAWSDKTYLSGSGGRSFLFVYRLFDLFGISAQDKGGAQVAGNFEDWLADRPTDGRPAFVFINFLEAHFPYHQTPAEFLSEFTDASPRELRRFSLETFGAQFGRTLTEEERLRAIGPTTDMYDAGILYSDYLLRRVIEALKDANRLDNTILVVLADHGEMLGEHQAFGYVLSLHEPDLHVPLLIRYPPAIEGGTRIESPVSTVGVFLTVLDFLNIESPSPSHATNLIPDQQEEAVGQPVIAERFANSIRPRSDDEDGKALERNIRYRIFRSGRMKLVQTDTDERYLFDLDADAQELNNLASSRPELLEDLEAELADWVERLELPAIDAEVEVSEEPEMDDATRERLKALGYVE